jgi:hypothetical protein
MTPTPKKQPDVICDGCGTSNDASRTQCISCKGAL